MSVNNDTLNRMIKFFQDDAETIEMIVKALETFEQYHQAIYTLEITRRLYSCKAIDSDEYRDQASLKDRTRNVTHNALLGQVNFLNRLAEEAGVPPFYDGIVSEERPYLREVAHAVLEFVRQVIIDRV